MLRQQVDGAPRVALFFDTAEAWSGLESWLRDSFLPSLPEHYLVAVASRRRPSSEWLHDPGWGGVFTALPLSYLHREESKAMLTARGIASPEHERLLFDSGGHPLALVLHAEVTRQAGATTGLLAQSQHVVSALLERFSHDAPDEDCRYALYACAHARVIDEGMLRTLLSGPHESERARRAYDWLRELSFSHEGDEGLALHELAAVALDTELRRRDRERYRALHVALRDSLLSRLEGAQPAERTRLACDLVWLHRFSPAVRPWTDWEASQRFFPSALRDSDRRDIIASRLRFEGEQAARAVERWLVSQPHAFTVIRSDAGQGVGYVMHPRLSREDAERCDYDPVMKAALDHAMRVAPPRDDETIALVDWHSYESLGEPHPSFVAGSLQIVLFFLSTPRLSWTCIPILKSDVWLSLMRQIGHHPGPEVSLDGRQFVLCMHDWRARSTSSWLDAVAEHDPPAREQDVAGPPASARALNREAPDEGLGCPHAGSLGTGARPKWLRKSSTV